MKEKKIALIVGGSSGIGAACAVKLAQDPDWVIYITGRRLEKLEAVAKSSGNIVPVVGDMSSEESAHQVFEQVLAEHSRLELLINAVGTFSDEKALSDFDLGDFDKAIEGNLRPLFLSNRFADQQFRKSGKGLVINIASRAGIPGDALPYRETYSAVKGAMVGFTNSLDQSLRPSGGRAFVVAPGLVHDTEMGQKVLGANPGAHGQGMKAEQAAALICSLLERTQEEDFFFRIEMEEGQPRLQAIHSVLQD